MKPAAVFILSCWTALAAEPPKNAGYVLRDGSVAIVGYNDMSGIFANLNALFIRAHPGVAFKMQLKGTATAAPALTLGVSAFAPMGAEFSEMELEAYKSFVGASPMLIRVAHCSLSPSALSAPVGIFVNKANPIQELTVEQVARIFTTGGPGGDFKSWGQVGLKGEWARRPIHPCGIAEEAAAGLAAFMLRKMGGRPFAPDYDQFAQSSQVVKRVGEDPLAIGFASGNIVTGEAKLLAIAEKEGGPASSLTASEVVSGKYPYDRHLLIYVRRVPGEPIDPFVKEYLRLVLSREGQQAIATAPPSYLPLNAQEVKEELAKLEPTRGAPYVRSAGSDGFEEILTKLNEHFAETHPELKFKLLVTGLPSISMYGLITGVSSFALTDREIWPLETRPFRQIYGYEPTAIRIGRAGYSGPGRTNPPGVYVNAKNPLAGLTVEQVARVFTTSGRNGDLTHWGQLGLKDAWTQRAIHLYGPPDDGCLASALRHSKMDGLPFARHYERLSTCAEIIHAIAMDRYGIALAGFCDAKLLSPAVKMLPLAKQEGAPFAGSTYAEVLAGKYPLSPHLCLYVNRAPGKPLEPFVKEYARLLLSREGQAIVATQKDMPKGYLPLNPKEVAEELTKLER